MLPYNSIVYYDDFSYERSIDMREFTQNTYMTALLESIKERCILVLGGDGTMLRAIGEHADKDIPFLWLNFGHKGFLLNDVSWSFPEISPFKSRDYPLLQVWVNGVNIGSAFNDIHLYSPEWKAIRLDIQNGSGQLELWGDGVILASPAWSTWHSKSYGGAILPHISKNIIVTPKGNIEPQTPKVLSDSSPIFIKNSWRKYPLALNIDWKQVFVSEVHDDISIEVQKSSETLRLLISEKHLQDWDNKVIQEQGFKV